MEASARAPLDDRSFARADRNRNGFAALSEHERTRRFWTAHGRSADDLTVLHAFCHNPTVSWNPELLSMWYGIRLDRAHGIVEELARCDIVRPAGGERGYRWNAAHDWAVPCTAEARRLVQARWAAAIGCPDVRVRRPARLGRRDLGPRPARPNDPDRESRSSGSSRYDTT